jgi:hypothetical protein
MFNHLDDLGNTPSRHDVFGSVMTSSDRFLIAAGRMKHKRVGAKIVIRREWLDAFLGA